MKNNTIVRISFLQFIGPILVILGHSLNGYSELGLDIIQDTLWYDFSKIWIYTFHMPLFFLVSGYLFIYKGGLKGEYSAFIKKKTKRLLLPYFLWNMIFFIPKVLASTVISDQVSINVVDCIKMFIQPRTNVLGHTWFLVALFLVYLFAPLWDRLFHSRSSTLATVFVCFVVLYFLPINSYTLCISDLHKDLLFFYVGGLLAKHDKDNKQPCLLSKSYLLVFISGVLVSVFGVFLIKRFGIWEIAMVVAMNVLLALLYFPDNFNIYKSERTLSLIKKISNYSFQIYILHWPVMLVTRVILYQLLNLPYVFVVTVMVFTGYFVPLLIVFITEKITNKFLRKLLTVMGF